MMRTRSRKIGSLIVGIAILILAAVGFFLIPGSAIVGDMPDSGMTVNLVRIVWIAVGLIAAGLAFYNAFGRRTRVPHETDSDVYTVNSPSGSVCSKCGKPVGESDRFCRNCGAYLRA